MASLRERRAGCQDTQAGGSPAGQWYMEESQIPKPCSRKPALGGLFHHCCGMEGKAKNLEAFEAVLAPRQDILPWDIPGGIWWIYF